jgi:NAD(P)-dependent dehydrogenase (short-subunit alcohol dehydrogenase family)
MRTPATSAGARKQAGNTERGEACARYVHLDATRFTDWSDAVRVAEDSFGPLTTLVNNAGVSGRRGVEETSETEWHHIIDTDLMSAWLGMKACIPAIRRAGGSAVVNTSSVYGLVASGAAAAYHAAKGGILMLSRAAAVEYASQGSRVNCIHPGRSPRVTAGRPRRRVTASSSSSAVWWMRNAVRPQMQAGIMGRLTCYSLALCSGSASLTAERTHDPLTFCPIPSG